VDYSDHKRGDISMNHDGADAVSRELRISGSFVSESGSCGANPREKVLSCSKSPSDMGDTLAHEKHLFSLKSPSSYGNRFLIANTFFSHHFIRRVYS
jgi:hypothetical protein